MMVAKSLRAINNDLIRYAPGPEIPP